MLQDLRYALRTMLQQKGWTVVVVMSLALGIGANTALFSVIDAKLLRKLPVKQPDDLVFFAWTSKTWAPRTAGNVTSFSDDATGEMIETRSASFSYAAFEELRASAGTLSDVFMFDRPVQTVAIIDGQADPSL
jgi:hypothetical protein